MKKILTFKHWQLFLLIVIAGAWTSPSPLKEIIKSISILTFTCWIYSIGIYGQEKVNKLGLPTMNLNLFKINIFLLPLLIAIAYLTAPEQSVETPQDLSPLTIVYIPIVFYMIFAVFQTVIFSIKTLTTLELKKEVSFGDYFVNLLLTFILIVGIWILQPKIKRIIFDDESYQKE